MARSWVWLQPSYDESIGRRLRGSTDGENSTMLAVRPVSALLACLPHYRTLANPKNFFQKLVFQTTKCRVFHISSSGFPQAHFSGKSCRTRISALRQNSSVGSSYFSSDLSTVFPQIPTPYFSIS